MSTVTILIPAHNEEKMIAACVDSCLRQTRVPDQIIVVNDGSTDRTGEILASYGDTITVYTTERATGSKSKAQEFGIPHVTGDILIATDADTILDRSFVAEICATLTDPTVYAVAGYVQSLQHNWLTALREIDYLFGQDLHKRAQSYMNYVLVIPGCGAAFRSYLFKDKHITFDHDTLTEDLDFTYKLHRLGLQIAFNPRAIVYTQDPPTLSSYLNQMRRWYGGSWQNLKKHTAVLQYPHAALQLSVNYIEGIAYAFLFFVLPFVHFTFFLYFLVLNTLTSVVIGLYAAIRRKRLDLLYYSPLAMIQKAINSIVFLEQFVLEMVLQRKNMTWFHPERSVLKKHQAL